VFKTCAKICRLAWQNTRALRKQV